MKTLKVDGEKRELALKTVALSISLNSYISLKKENSIFFREHISSCFKLLDKGYTKYISNSVEMS